MTGTASRNLLALADDLERLPMTGMIAAAKAGKKLINDSGTRLVGADGMKGKKRRGLKLKSRDTIRDTGTGATLRLQGSIPGWIWATSGTAPHAIRRRKRGPMRKMTVPHPGHRGSGVWGDVAERVARVVPQIFADELGRII